MPHAPQLSVLWSRTRLWLSSGVGKWVGIALAVVLGFQVLYLLAANVVLAYFLPGWLAADNFKLSYSAASSWWPGRVHVEDLSIRSHDYNIQFQLDIEDASVSVALHRLPFREFSGDDVEARGVVFKLRHNVESLEAAKRRIDAFPTIEGYPEPPVYRKPPEPPVPEAEDKRFTIQLTDVRAEVRELWMLEYRYQGDARATGGFRLQPGRALRLEPATLNLLGGTLTLGERAIATATMLDATAEIDAPELQKLPGRKIFKTITASIEADLKGGDLGFLDTYIPAARGAALSGGFETQAKLAVRTGVLQPQSKLIVKSPTAGLRMSKPAVGVTANLTGELTVESEASPAIRLSSDVRDLKSDDRGPSLKRGAAVFVIPEVDLSAALKPRLRALSIDDFAAPDLGWFEALLPKQSAKLAGRALLAARWDDPNQKEATGKVNLSLTEATVAANDKSFVGDLTLDVKLGRDSDNALTLNPLELEFSRTKLSITQSESDLFAARIVSNSSRWMRDRKPAAFQGTFDIFMRPAEALLPVLMADAPATVSQALLSLQSLHARVAVFLASEHKRVELLQAGTGPVEAKGAWEQQSSNSTGAFLLNTWLVNLGVSLKDGESSLDVGADKSFLKQAP